MVKPDTPEMLGNLFKVMQKHLKHKALGENTWWFVFVRIKEDLLVGSSGQQINHSLGERVFFNLRSQPPLIISLAPDRGAFEAASQKDLHCLGGSEGKAPLRDAEQRGGVEALSSCCSASIPSKAGVEFGRD